MISQKGQSCPLAEYWLQDTSMHRDKTIRFEHVNEKYMVGYNQYFVIVQILRASHTYLSI